MATPPQHQLGGLNVAILVTDGFEQEEMTAPRAALEESGVIIRMLSDKTGQVQGYHHDQRGDLFDVDMTFDKATADEFDAILLPGGAVNSIRIRSHPDAQRLVQEIDEQAKPIGVICHAPWLLVSAGLVKGHKMTSWPTLQSDIEKAGGLWVDAEVVVDRNWVSSRKPDDIPAFNEAFKRVLAQRTRRNIQGTPDDISSAVGEDG
ncbi:MAG: type 1 glutamine amidotransferase [Pseudomonadota bacterium]|nr:type 1 glutamine amidotransferase [Pseudomonadota bacterium]